MGIWRKKYMKQPQGCEVKGKDKLVCKMNKSMNGLKQYIVGYDFG